MVMYMFFSLIATFITEGLIFMGIYLYETEIIAVNIRRCGEHPAGEDVLWHIYAVTVDSAGCLGHRHIYNIASDYLFYSHIE